MSAIGRTYLKLGDLALQEGDFSTARSDYENARRVCASIRDKRCIAEAENNFALTARRLGDIESALDGYQQARDLFHSLAIPDYEGAALSNLGSLFIQTAEYDRAIDSYLRTISILQTRDRNGYARALNNLGAAYRMVGEPEKAITHQTKALAVFRDQHAESDLTRASNSIARAHLAAGHLSTAQRLLEELLHRPSLQTDRSVRADALNNLGQTLRARGQLDAAHARLTQALDLYLAMGDKRNISVTRLHLGWIAAARGDTALARELLTSAVDITTTCGLRDDAAESLYALASVEFDAGNLDAARAHAERALRLLEAIRTSVPSPNLRASFYTRKRRFFDLLVEIAVASSPDPAAGLLAAERARGRALLDQLADNTVIRRLPSDLLARRAEIQRKINYLSQSLATAKDDRERDLRERVQLLLGEHEEVEARIRAASDAPAFAAPLESLDDLRRDSLPPDTALLEYHLGERRSYLWCVDRNAVRVFLLPARAVVEKEIETVVAGFGAILDRRRSPDRQARFDRALRRLSATLLGPLGAEPLPPRIVLALDAPLLHVPFAALYLRGGKQRLGLAHDLLLTPAAAYLRAGKAPRLPSQFPKSILAIADPIFTPDDPRVAAKTSPAAARTALPLPRLPFTAELDAIAGAVPATRRRILRGLDATVPVFRAARPNQFGVVHLSTHALIDDRIPELSRVTLSQFDSAGRGLAGSLHPYDLAGLRLDGSVVVLSACETALGKQVIGEGLAGLTNSLLYAGAGQLVLSLSAVDAEASSELFATAYRRAFGPRPVPMERALTAARRALAASDRWSDPYYWASFVVIGRPAPSR